MNWIRPRLLDFLDDRLTRRPDAFDDDSLRSDAIVLSPHGDDETLGCGGTIARKRAAGAAIQVVVMTDGGNSHAIENRNALVATRRAETIRALAELGVPPEKLAFFDYPDGDLSSHMAEATNRIRELMSASSASQVFVPYRHDGHPDHQATYRIVRAALNDWPTDVTVWEYPIWAYRHWPWVRLASPLQRDPGQWRATVKFLLGLRFVMIFSATSDISESLATKKAALRHFESQLSQSLPEGTWSLARLNQGDFLGRFGQPVEVFRKTVIRAKNV